MEALQDTFKLEEALFCFIFLQRSCLVPYKVLKLLNEFFGFKHHF